MKQIITAILGTAFVVSAIAVIFTITQAEKEEQRLTVDLQHRATLLAENLRNRVEPFIINDNQAGLSRTVNTFEERERLAGLVIFDNKENIIASSSSFQKEQVEVGDVAANAMDQDKLNAQFVTHNNKRMYVFAIPLRKDESIIGALTIIQNASFIDARVQEVWKNNLLRLSIQIFLISIAMIFILRFIIYQPIARLVESIRLARMGNTGEVKRLPESFLFEPLVREISSINRSLLEARLSASEEARLRLEKLDSPWTAERLKEFIKELIKGRTMFVVSNREPYIHIKKGGKISYFVPASGPVTALEPIMQACEGVWIAHGSGNADKLVVDKNDKVRVPPDEPHYSLRRVWLSTHEEKGYYYGFANEGIWPLCHIAHTRPIFRKEDWEEYKRVNGKFAQVVLSEIKSYHKPIILIQDYHFALLPTMLKNARPDAQIVLFWHVPWPNAEAFSICPFRKEILQGMLGADLVGFHTQYHCNNFIDTVGRELESLIDLEQFSITKDEHTTYIKPFPISIAFPNSHLAKTDGPISKEAVLKKLGIKKNAVVGLGVDRMDYTKGILERLKSVAYFLETNPAYREHFVFIQIAPPSRSQISEYQKFAEKIKKEVVRINNKFGKNGWKPIVLLEKHHSHEELNEFYKLADVCMVTSLHDGMNLVAKEFVSVRSDERGVLILSHFAGASRELKDALIINPYHIEQTAQALRLALEMSQTEQKRRMKKMRETIKNNNVYRWSAELLKTVVSLE